mmetsp:Transcript_13676/g.36853  ORF Transcript_13676/g.36853 Transcript_13676/m.36853 type:complete len:290 (-) Transcript_13676:144-1013(-)
MVYTCDDSGQRHLCANGAQRPQPEGEAPDGTPLLAQDRCRPELPFEVAFVVARHFVGQALDMQQQTHRRVHRRRPTHTRNAKHHVCAEECAEGADVARIVQEQEAQLAVLNAIPQGCTHALPQFPDAAVHVQPAEEGPIRGDQGSCDKDCQQTSCDPRLVVHKSEDLDGRGGVTRHEQAQVNVQPRGRDSVETDDTCDTKTLQRAVDHFPPRAHKADLQFRPIVAWSAGRGVRGREGIPANRRVVSRGVRSRHGKSYNRHLRWGSRGVRGPNAGYRRLLRSGLGFHNQI